jgi:4'-phosphopantetheinyl transferase
MDEAGFFPLPESGETVHVWRAELVAGAADESALDETELARARRFHFARDRQHFTAARAILRTLLGRYLGAAAREVGFGYSARGKPFVVSLRTELKFNVSHSGGRALYAFALGREVGIDLEAGERLKEDWIGLTKRVFSPRERTELAGLPDAGQRDAFLDGWTRKEALLKAQGLGISDGLQQMEVTLGPERPPRLLAVGGEASEGAAMEWTLFDLRAVAGMAAALAVGGAGRARMQAFRWAWGGGVHAPL